MDDLKHQLKLRIIEELNLEEITPEDIEDDAPLFVEGLGLDSIDALELLVILEYDFGVKVPDEETGRKVLHSVNTIAEYVEKEQKNKS